MPAQPSVSAPAQPSVSAPAQPSVSPVTVPSVSAPSQPSVSPVSPVTGQVHDKQAYADLQTAMPVLQKIMHMPFELAESQGRYAHNPQIGSTLMYIASELAEAHEAYAANKHADANDVAMLEQMLNQGRLDQFNKYFKAVVKSTFEDELADIALLVMSIAGYYKVDLAKHVMLKHLYNAGRLEHSAIHSNANN